MGNNIMTYNANQHTLEAPEPKYYARIPNMAVDDLNYAELALYVHYKRVASDNGACWQSTKQIAESLGMGQKKLRKTRNALVSKGFIAITMRMNDDEIECNSRVISIVDVWKTNVERYTPPSQMDIPPLSKSTYPPSQMDIQRKTNKKNQKKNHIAAAQKNAATGTTSADDKCATCGYTYRFIFDHANNKHRVCNCTTGEDMRKSGFVEHANGSLPPAEDNGHSAHFDPVQRRIVTAPSPTPLPVPPAPPPSPAPSSKPSLAAKIALAKACTAAIKIDPATLTNRDWSVLGGALYYKNGNRVGHLYALESEITRMDGFVQAGMLRALKRRGQYVLTDDGREWVDTHISKDWRKVGIKRQEKLVEDKRVKAAAKAHRKAAPPKTRPWKKVASEIEPLFNRIVEHWGKPATKTTHNTYVSHSWTLHHASATPDEIDQTVAYYKSQDWNTGKNGNILVNGALEKMRKEQADIQAEIKAGQELIIEEDDTPLDASVGIAYFENEG
jgi:hypothetical protein